MIDARKRTGAETKAEVQRVALSLFGSQGYEATSLRQIADELGIRKASLYYHFASKEEIVRSTFTSRADEAHALLEWATEQPRSPDLLERTVLRWVGTFSVDKLRGIRFVNANPLLVRAVAAGGGAEIGDSLGALVDLLTEDERDASRVLLVRMAFLSINAAAFAASGSAATDDEIVASAREAALAILERLRG